MWFNGQDSTFSLLRAQADSLVRELRFQKLHGSAKRKWYPGTRGRNAQAADSGGKVKGSER